MATQNPEWLEEALKTVVTALECIMDVASTNEARANAYKVCEDFRENCPTCIECGFQLAQKTNPDIVRHFGLQSVEHMIKYRWNEVTDEKKADLKKISLDYIFQGTNGVLTESRHIKDAVTRILVELMKRMWPQLWDDLFIDFTRLSEFGETQTELVLLVLLRLCEDVVSFQSVPAPRCRDLRQALGRAMPSIVTFFVHILTKCVCTLKMLKEGTDGLAALAVCYAVLETLQGFVEWIPVVHITETALLPQICSLLLDEDQGLRLRAAECLLLVVGRRTNLAERKPLMILFSKEGMTLLLRAATNATERISSPDHSGFYLLFLKRLCEILLELGKQLCALWGSDVDQGRPENFDMYLKAVLAFTQHPCLSLRDMTIAIWQMLLKHKEASVDQNFKDILPALVQSASTCLLKLGYPSQHNSIICDYSRKEFDSDEDFTKVLINLRMQVLELVRKLTEQQPCLVFEAGGTWLKELLSQPVDKDRSTGLVPPSSMAIITWDGCSVFMEAVVGKLDTATQAQELQQEGASLLKAVLNYDGRQPDLVNQLFKVATSQQEPQQQQEDPLVLSSVLSCLSALFPFLAVAPDTLQPVIARIKKAVILSLPGETRSTRSQAVRNVRLHGCSVFVKLCSKFPQLMVPDFKAHYDGIKALDGDPEAAPNQMERTILLEGLIVVSNQFQNYDLQSAFIEEVMAPVKELWTSPDISAAFSSPQLFMSYIGLDRPAVEPSSEDTCGIQRSHVHHCISMILAVVKRSKWPEEPGVASLGGFVVPCSGSGYSMRNPAFPHVISTFNNLIQLLKTICSLFKPEYLALRHPDFQLAFEMTENEKMQYLGLKQRVGEGGTDCLGQVTYKKPLDRMQTFLTNLCEISFHIMGNSATWLGSEFYSPRWAAVLMDNVTCHVHLLPDSRLKMVVHNFLKPFLLHCPHERYDDVAVPLLQSVCPFFYERLVSQWKMLNERVEQRSQNDEDEPTDTNEILEETLIRALTKEYLEFVNQILFKDNRTSEVKEESAMEECNTSVSEEKSGGVKELCDLGLKIVSVSALYPSLMMCIISGLSWADSFACRKCADMLWPLCKKLHEMGELTGEAAQFTFMAVLAGVSLHGEHEALHVLVSYLALTLYENLRKDFSNLTSVLEQIPNLETNTLQELHKKYLDTDYVKTDEKSDRNRTKKKKDLFKKITSSIAGKHISQKFKRATQYSRLPPLFLPSYRKKHGSVEDTDAKSLGLAELFTPEAGGNN